ncbi:MAG: SHOCT-like domain-containing protein [Anaerolineales bacterium]
MDEQPRLQILKMIEDGKLNAEDGIRLLNALSGSAAVAAAEAKLAPAPEAIAPKSAPTAAAQSPPPDFAYWRSWWRLPFALGTAFTVIIAALAFWAWRAADNQLTVWFGLLMCPLAFGVLVMALALASRTAKWLHLRVNTGRDEFPRRIALSLPMPIGPLRWVVNLIAQFNPELQKRGVTEMITALGSDLSSDNPLYVEVDEGEGGEKVQVYIG